MVREYMIAGLRVQMDTFGKTEKQAAAYEVPMTGKPDVVIEQLAEQFQQKSAPHATLDSCEYMMSGASFYKELLEYDGMLLHASAVVVDGYAYLFSAKSGTGKSTHTNLWLKKFGDAAYILNDDKPAIRKEDGRWYAYGTPWSGKTDLNVNKRVPLGGICMLHRGERNEIAPHSGAVAVYELLEQTLRPSNALRIQVLELLDDVMQSVRVWKLYCTPDEEAVNVSYKAMSEAAKKLG
ncbi:MAG: hypothetical protein IIY04_02300 [Oscillospiraceae bacterium]|nr:hypothetical protein [Oscillospiraceae bacterium]